MTYRETLDFLYSQLPMYQRVGAVAFKKDLKNIFALCHALKDPQLSLKGIHIAGTNGKGSTAHILAAIYRKNGYKTGLYTSPHLVDFRERIRIDGKMISKTMVTGFVKKMKPQIERIKPSFFEMSLAMAFDCFARHKVDIAIIETGLGGRLDSTNVFIPDLSIITSISRDHTEMLGESIEEITWEKAGIIKNHIPTVIGLVPDEAREILKYIADQRQSVFYDSIRLSHRFTKSGPVKTDLRGDFQQLNIKTALTAVEALQEKFPTQDELTLSALNRVKKLSRLQGRWQILQNAPMVICDVAHNPEGLLLSVTELQKLSGDKHLVLGFVKEKKMDEIIPLFPAEWNYYFVKPEIPRGKPAEEVRMEFEKHGIEGLAFPSLNKALKKVRNTFAESGRDQLLYVGGSNFLVADLLSLNVKKFEG